MELDKLSWTMTIKWGATVVIAACLAVACRAETRAAICFYGLTRSLPYTIDTIRSNIFDPLVEDGISYSVFLHTYNVTEVRALCREQICDNTKHVCYRKFRALLRE